MRKGVEEAHAACLSCCFSYHTQHYPLCPLAQLPAPLPLQDGGNAFDAAIAATLCQGVLNPFASGAGGGAFIVARAANGTAEFIDGRETAPAAANVTMYDALPDAVGEACSLVFFFS